MRNILALIGLAVIGFAGLGWYFQWYSFASHTGLDGRTKYELDVDTKRMAEDAKTFGNKVSKAVASEPASNAPAPGVTGPPAPPAPPAPAPTGGVTVGPDGLGIQGPGIDIRIPPPKR